MINQLKCKSSGSLLDVIRVINENANGVAFIVDEDDTFIGILTDGDIRRLLLDGVDLGSKIGAYSNVNCIKASVHDSFDEMMSKTNVKVSILPILNDEGKLVDFFQYQNKVYIPVASPNLKGNEFKYLVDAFLSTWISSSGEYLDRFEQNFSKYCETDYGVAVSNGTVALHLALLALGIGEGDEVIVPDLTFAASINAVLHANATPVIVDVEEDSWCIDPHEIRKAITDKTKAIMPVHLYGQPCDMDAIMAIAEEFHLFVIEDAAEAHGALYKGKKVGSFGDIGCFSFFGNKVITTGEGGMCVTNSLEYNDKMRVLRDHGMSKTKRYWHDVVGYNYRMTNIQAAIGVAQLERIDVILENREKYELAYIDALGHMDHIHFQKRNLKNRTKITWLTCLLVDKDRDLIMEKVKSAGIDVRPLFYPLSDMPLYKEYVKSSKTSSKISEMGFSLPTSSELPKKSMDKLIHVFSEFN